MSEYTAFMLLFMVATAVAIAVQYVKVPYTVALVIVGLVLGFFHALNAPVLTKEILFSFFLPGLLFEASYKIDFKKIWQNRITVTSLAIPGVVMSIVLIALLLAPLINALDYSGFNWKHALVFGAIISATDPVAVLAIIKSMKAPKRLSLLLEGESLLNDGTAIVFFTMSLGLFSATQMTAGSQVLDFIKTVGLGAAIGIGTALAAVQVFKKVNDPMVEITVTFIVAYGSFLIAEHFHFSGVIATVSAGLISGNHAKEVGMLPPTKIAVETFWQYIAFAINSIVFLLIGLEVKFVTLLQSRKVILAAFLVVLAGRVLVISAATFFLRKTREKIPWKWSPVLIWGGFRGAIPMVLVLTLPAGFPFRALLINITFGVVILSILLQGLSLSRLLVFLKIVNGSDEKSEYEYLKGKLQAAHAGLKEIGHLSHLHFMKPESLENLKNDYRKRINENVNAINDLKISQQDLEAEEHDWALRHLLLTEKHRIIEAYHKGAINSEARDKLLLDIDTKLLEMDT
ncbi:MAG TPA: Na+/H+ antiporter [Bacteroidales bacterium]|nr:Na+/H+ antiporter [Bacteroidales bacterium]